MHITHESLGSVIKKTNCAVIVKVQSASKPQIERFHKTINITAIPLKVIFGELNATGAVLFRYLEGRPHFRNQTTVSPLVSGSGQEFDLKKGDEAIFLLGTNNNESEYHNLLRVETKSNLQVIKRCKKEIQ